jgi:hypothetical protein
MNSLDILIKKHKINKTWLGAQVGLTYHAFFYALNRGLREDEIIRLETAINALGKELMNFRVPEEYRKMKGDPEKL